MTSLSESIPSESRDVGLGEVAEDVLSRPAQQQPQWPDREHASDVGERLSRLPALVDAVDVRVLRGLLADVSRGKMRIVQSGDCAEDPAESTPEHVARKTGLLESVAGVLKMNTNKPVLRVGRIAGQFGKPRSKPTEWVDGRELPVYRGHMVNTLEPTEHDRAPDPERMLTGYRAAREVMNLLGWPGAATGSLIDPPVWTSHEALLLDYELPLTRRDPTGVPVLGSTHWPWIGERTRQLEGAHVALLSGVVNPVACKVGPTMTAEEIVALCERLDPEHVPGRLTLIARMGAEKVGERLPPLVRAVRASGHPVIWLSDPMHANTVSRADGLKTRLVETVVDEVRNFQRAVEDAGGVAGGLHLETTPEDVTECASNTSTMDGLNHSYTTLCDPRLNSEQALRVVSAWR
ncbi:phospho-2-dehydro-3-deoxyheptonate aldolase [Actinopolyspora erythraea]|uniref:Phospho-2-dehydro-3-deoxyheptonate aldolase n=1 Tax=Actinopolyspora erythraea TaxID=414996 RepID=A0A223RUW8_9ACTN|nr:3-deoxy-7-phosphoheptulonate synthase [Actinopolyspora erythraea]ASU79660.1 phospho-2-dehydro-3-deoxyheptonate aldolase [Actinopolyspora erythraea]